MKEYEKWLKEKLEKHIIPTSSYTWRAALEWMKEKLNCEIQPGDIEYFIDKELGS